MAEWQTHRTQNAAGNRVGSSPTAATTNSQIFGSAFFIVVSAFLVSRRILDLGIYCGNVTKMDVTVGENA